MPTIDVHTEQELANGWCYRLAVVHDSGTRTEHEVRLSWVDHDLWSGGRVPPSVVIQRVVEYLLIHGQPPGITHTGPTYTGPLPPSFDAARARRWWPAIDQELRAAI